LRGLLIAALYVSVFGCATPPRPAVPAVPPVPVEKAEKPADAEPAAEMGSVVTGQPAVAPVLPKLAAGTEHHIALILPLRSPVFGRAAEAVQLGFLAAAGQQTNELPVRVYSANDEKTEVAALYRQAVQQGALAVAGPLTRNGVAALAENPDLPVPTLVLNTLESPRTDQLYSFGLPPEAEARQAAQWAARAGLLTATVVRTDSALSRRLAQAFVEEWQRSGGVLWPEIVYAGDPSEIRQLSGEAGSMVFLAAEPDKARLIRPYIHSDIPVYATSQVFAGNADRLLNFDLAEVRFVDMPWVLQPDHPAVMIYPRVEPPYTQDMERLYALGVDAYRMLQVLYHHNTVDALPLDGVTGKLTLEGNQVRREAVKGILRGGQGMTLQAALNPRVPAKPVPTKPGQ